MRSLVVVGWGVEVVEVFEVILLGKGERRGVVVQVSFFSCGDGENGVDVGWWMVWDGIK